VDQKLTPDPLFERTVLVTGVTGEVGWGIAHAAAQRGARLVLPVRRDEVRAGLAREFGPSALVPLADFADSGSLARVRDEAASRFGGVDHVVAPLGAWWQKGASLAQPHDEVRALYAAYVDAPWLLLSTLAPALRAARGSFTFVTGVAGEAPFIPNAGLLVAAVAAQHALSRVLRHELAGEPFRVNEIRIATRIERAARPGVVPSKSAGATFLDALTTERTGALFRYDGARLEHDPEANPTRRGPR
jgi:NAD(P)-dependent dehydrogenase (short-subunit alcohol dehydrogenase family)